MYLANNIDIVQINIKAGVEEYYLPKNVNWRNRVVDKIVLVTANGALSPIDGITQLLDESVIENLYFDIYAADDTQIMRNVHAEHIYYKNNNVLCVGKQLSLNLSRLFFTQTPDSDGCILLYIFYGTRKVEDYTPAIKSVTVRVPLAANGKMSLQEIVDNYIYMQPNKVKGIYVWQAEEEPCYITLRDNDGQRTLNSVYSGLCRPPMQYAGSTAKDTQTHEMLLDNINIDMLNSFVQNATNDAVEKEITFLY